jgi:hypothetical protein
MGKQGEKAMIDLILDCGIYLSIESGRGSYHQLSGKSITLEFDTTLTVDNRRASWRPSKFIGQGSDSFESKMQRLS